MLDPRAGRHLRHAFRLLLLCFITMLGAGLPTSAQGSAGAFNSTGSMAVARQLHTATLLPNGQVLVAGGEGQANTLQTAELYDPSTGTWNSTGNLTAPRSAHTATLLPSGKVLIAGGAAGGSAVATAELYDPATGVWTATGSLAAPVQGHTATLLFNGQVLVTGGQSASSSARSGAQLYDPATGLWTATGSLGAARYAHSATLLPNGKVLVAGGNTAQGAYLNSAELYNPASATWSATGSLAVARGQHAAVVLTNGKVLIAGGNTASAQPTGSAALYDPATGIWSVTGSMTTARTGESGALMADGKFLMTGGSGASFTADLYDPLTGKWLSCEALNTPRSRPTATLLPSGQVLVAGGSPPGGSGSLTAAELFIEPTWVPTGNLSVGHEGGTAVLLPSGKVILLGGNAPSTQAVDLYDSATGLWTGLGPTNQPRQSHTATLLANGKVLLAGGDGSGSSTSTTSAELYNPATGTSSPWSSMIAGRSSHTATLLPNGLILVAGGWGSHVVAVASCELYDPATGRWSATGSLSAARFGHTAILVGNGKVLVAGGHASLLTALASAELYDPATGTWSATGDLATARYGHTASLLPDGRVLVAAGDGGGDGFGTPLVSAEMYDPATGLWSATGNLAIPRYSHTATVLSDGSVLVVGGRNSAYLPSTEIYDPAQGTWKTGQSLSSPRLDHSATLLPSGQVLVAGGYGLSGDLNTAELGTTRDLVTAPHVTSAIVQQDASVFLNGDHLLGSKVVVQLRNLANGQLIILHPSDSVAPTATSYTSAPVNGLQPGTYLVTVIVDGNPGPAALLQSSVSTPVVLAGAATAVGSVVATLHAEVLADGSAASVVFAYSTDPAVMQNVTLRSLTGTIPPGGRAQVSGSVRGLARGTTYYFRAVAATSNVTVQGDILSFTTALTSPNDPTPPDATIAPAGYLAVSRSQHAAVLLPSGQVRLAGGYGPLASAEVYDPATGLSRAVASMLKAHSQPTATLLPNGKILVVGVTSTGGQHDAPAEVYDPVAGTWSTASAATGGYDPTVTVLPNGQVLLAGGTYASNSATNAAALYDPVAGTTPSTGSMTAKRSAHTATLLPNGKVLVAGGSGGIGFNDWASAELYDPATGQWTATGSMTKARSFHTAALLPNGKVLVFASASTSDTSAELYDPATGVWTATGNLNFGRYRPTATVLPNGKVWVVGWNSTSPSTELYDPATGLFTLAENTAASRQSSTATLLLDGHVLVAGGVVAGGGWTLENEIYNPSRGFSATAMLPGTARGAHTATVLPSGKLLVAGGTNEAAGASNGLASAELYDSTDGSWTPTGSLTHARLQHTATLLANGKVLAAGGLDGAALATAELYDPASGMWGATGNLPGARCNHTATLLASGKVVLAGGENAGVLLTTAALYDPVTGTWTTAGSLVTPRKFHTASALPNGQMLIAGGWDATGRAVGSSELYDPASGTWRAVGDLVTARANHGAALLPDGRILVAGGRDDTGLLATAEVYDPATAMWMPTRDLYEARAFQTATSLVNGKVLMAEGLVGVDSGLHASGEIYDPATGRWVSAGPLVQGRTGHTTSLLQSGQVLLAGGDGSANAGTAELYDVGLGFDPARQAQLLGTSVPFGGGRALTLSGNRLLGPRGPGSGTSRDSHSYYPVVQLRNLATDQVQTLAPSPTPLTMATSWTSLPVSGLPLGYYTVTLFTNGIPSNSLVVQVDTRSPIVTPNAAAGLAARGATLNAQVTSNGLATTVSFAYGTDAAVTQNVVTTPTQAVAANASSALVIQAITGLSPHRTYYYQAIATNSDGTVKGAIVSFTTNNTAPTAPGGTATATTGDARTMTLPYAATDADGDALTLVSASGSNLTINGTNGSQVTFTPDAAFVGTATLTYQISDGTGLANGTASGSISVTVSDNDAPDTSITSAPSGVITTNSASISFGGTDNVGVASFQGRLDGAAFAPVTSPVNLTGLADGAHTYDVRALDAAGNVDATPARASWSVNTTVTPVDTTPPVLHLPADFTVEATSAAGAVVTYTASATDPGSGVASSSFTPGSGAQFALGTTVVQATATDVAGNTSTGSFRVTVRDTTPPDTVISSAPSGTIRSDGASITFSGTDNVGVKSFQGRLDGAPFATVTSPVNLAGMADGAHTFDVRALDNAGNVDATPARASWTVDTTITPVDTTPPVGVDDHYFSGSAARTPLTLPILENDTALHPDRLRVANVTRPLYGSAVIAGDGRSIIYTPAISYASFAGEETFSYTLRDEFGTEATAKVTISNGAYREKGIYDGLLLESAKVLGYVQVNLAATGAFTGTLKLGAVSSVIRGQFDVDKHATVDLPGASLSLEFDGVANIAATYFKGALAAEGTLTHETYNAANNPAPQAGSYTVLLPPPPARTGTAAIATVSISPTTHKIDSLGLLFGGSGYETPPLVTILAPVGSGGNFRAALMNGAVVDLPPVSYGMRYPIAGAAVLIDPPEGALPAGIGYATMKVSQSGAVTLAGQVGDGTMLSASGWLKEDHTLALYSIVAYRPGPAGTLSGVIRFNEVQDVSDFDGDLAWSKPHQTGAALYQTGFETTSHLIGSHYRSPLRGEQSLVFTNTVTGVATFTTSGGDFLNAVNDTVSVSNANLVKKTSASADRLLLKIVPATGLFSGTFAGVYPMGTTATKTVSTAFAGVLFQKQNLGLGLLTGPRHTGEVALTPQ